MKYFTTVKAGSKGTDVFICQSLLRAMQFRGSDGKPISIDGECGSNTVFAINSFQTQQRAYGYECGSGSKNDGMFGGACWKRMLGV